MTDKNVTDKVEFDYSDDELLPLTKCVCGQEFDYWQHTLSVYRDDARECPKCGRKLYWVHNPQIFEVDGE